jgi:GTP-binding protein EngB required for normal cell division
VAGLRAGRSRRPKVLQLTAAIFDQGRAADLAALLSRASVCVPSANGGFSRYVTSLDALRERLVAERLQVAVLGQFKRGKSTFLNALLGAPILPTGVIPLTAIATFIRWAATPSLCVTYLDGRRETAPLAPDIDRIREQLTRFVTEEGNPRNHLQVARVDLAYPASILEQGVVLIDTPGVGSTLRHNTEAALEVLPECDVGFFVLSPDPPITEAELSFLDRIRPNVAQIFFILNKIDYLDRRDREAAIDFRRRTLSEHIPRGTDVTIHVLSSRHALEAKEASDPDGLATSGLAEIEHQIADFLARDKIASLRRAIRRKGGRSNRCGRPRYCDRGARLGVADRRAQTAGRRV